MCELCKMLVDMAVFFNYTLITYSNRKQKLDWEKHKKFDIHPYAVLELKQLVSKEAAVKATPTPTTPGHP